MKLEQVLLRGTSGAKPAASSVPTGSLYYSTDTEVLEQTDGSAWNTYSPTGAGVSELTGDVTAGPGSGSQVATIANDAVTYAKMQDISAASRLLGRGSAGGAGNPEELTIGSGLTLTGTVLDATPATPVRRQVTLVIDGGGAVITTGIKGYLSLPVSGTWKKWRLLSTEAGAPTGSIVIDVWKDVYASYPPAVADSITAAAKPTLSAANSNEDSTLTGWTTSFTAGDVLGFNVDSISGLTKVSLSLEFE